MRSLASSTTKSKSTVARGSVSAPIAWAPTSAHRAPSCRKTATTRAIFSSIWWTSSSRWTIARVAARIARDVSIFLGNAVGISLTIVARPETVPPARPRAPLT